MNEVFLRASPSTEGLKLTSKEEVTRAATGGKLMRNSSERQAWGCTSSPRQARSMEAGHRRTGWCESYEKKMKDQVYSPDHTFPR